MPKTKPRPTISDDATIGSMVDQISNPLEYVRRVMERMSGLRRSDKDVLVRIARVGNVKYPDYRFDNFIREGDCQSSWPIEGYSGRFHTPLTNSKIEDDSLWASNFLEYADLQEVMKPFRSLPTIGRGGSRLL